MLGGYFAEFGFGYEEFGAIVGFVGMIVVAFMVVGLDVVVDVVEVGFALFGFFADFSESFVFEEVVHEHDSV